MTPDQLAWIEARIATGEFDTVDEAVGRCIDPAIIDNALIGADDLAWAKPLVEEALAEVERGDVVSLEELKASMRKAVEHPSR